LGLPTPFSTHTDEVKETLRLLALNRATDPIPGSVTTVHDYVKGTTVEYKSIRAVARLFQCSIATVKKHDGKLYRMQYFIKIVK
jgi:hypothetical protein